ncbi:uncharacterized protein TRUGW13939_07318 [Talaromyces rugulosus]|uniref:Lipocalin-like domain-containing protein n=1 Tax=Talaromyces rugulosus TaxID=121627 RepID=A0A7H8R3H2_TALRU|nr:uncharacterized protein TRUGW13939_07318 [Talaromyces rugulosus]QKX60175.1 hypothetical protein TRUGW13939_07318 [Talaromyces rugulosus]
MPSTVEVVRKGLVGTWKLVSFVSKPVAENGTVGYPLGKDAQGYIIYTAAGYMSAQIMALGSKPYTSEDIYHAKDDEAAEAARHYLAYSGPFDVISKGEDVYVKHHMDVALVSNWIGNHQLRKCEWRGDEITLSPEHPWMVNGSLVNQYLTFKRL